jgi:hypothetical protein
MAKWTNNRMNLGSLGELAVQEGTQSGMWWWQWETEDAVAADSGTKFWTDPGPCRLAAEAWMRKSLKQAAKALEG